MLTLCFVDLIRGLVRLVHLISVGCVLTACAEIPAYTSVVPFVSETNQLSEVLGLHHQVDSFWLLVVIDEVGDDDIYEFGKILSWVTLLNSPVMLGTNMACKCSKVLVTPLVKCGLISLEAVVKHLICVFLGCYHAYH